MTPTECVALCRLAQATCPQQAVDQWTPDAWHPLLSDLRFEDAKAALLTVARRQPFVAPAEIRAEVRRIRAKRLEAAVLDPPASAADDPAAYIAWLRAETRAIADGAPAPAPEALVRIPDAQMRELLAEAFPRRPDADAPAAVSREKAPQPSTDSGQPEKGPENG